MNGVSTDYRRWIVPSYSVNFDAFTFLEITCFWYHIPLIRPSWLPRPGASFHTTEIDKFMQIFFISVCSNYLIRSLLWLAIWNSTVSTCFLVSVSILRAAMSSLNSAPVLQANLLLICLSCCSSQHHESSSSNRFVSKRNNNADDSWQRGINHTKLRMCSFVALQRILEFESKNSHFIRTFLG